MRKTRKQKFSSNKLSFSGKNIRPTRKSKTGLRRSYIINSTFVESTSGRYSNYYSRASVAQSYTKSYVR